MAMRAVQAGAEIDERPYRSAAREALDDYLTSIANRKSAQTSRILDVW
jgi:hypothetical protein